MNCKNDDVGEFKSKNIVDEVVFYKNVFFCFWDDNLVKCLVLNISSVVWINCVNVVMNLSSFVNLIGDKLFYI